MHSSFLSHSIFRMKYLTLFTWSGRRQITSAKGENRRKYSVRMCVAKRARHYARHKGEKGHNFPDVRPYEYLVHLKVPSCFVMPHDYWYSCTRAHSIYFVHLRRQEYILVIYKITAFGNQCFLKIPCEINLL